MAPPIRWRARRQNREREKEKEREGEKERDVDGGLSQFFFLCFARWMATSLPLRGGCGHSPSSGRSTDSQALWPPPIHRRMIWPSPFYREKEEERERERKRCESVGRRLGR